MKFWILLPLIVLLFAACSQDQDNNTLETASGLQYEILASGDGEWITVGRK